MTDTPIMREIMNLVEDEPVRAIGHKWASDIKQGDVLRINGNDYIVKSFGLTPTKRHIKVSFEGGNSKRFHVGNSVSFLKAPV